MAIIWSKTVEHIGEPCGSRSSRKYEVRQAGKTVRLYIDGVLHTQYNPNRITTGSVWDILAAPTKFMKYKPRRVLLLGLGGGAVIHALRNLWGDKIEFTAVEFDKPTMDIAKRFFSLPKSTQLVHGDGVQWVKQCRHQQFDLIIDDMFTEEAGQPVRVAKMNRLWLSNLKRLLSPSGAIILNFASPKELKESISYFGKWEHKVSCSTPTCYNRVVGLFRKSISANQFRCELGKNWAWDEKRSDVSLRFRIRSIT